MKLQLIDLLFTMIHLVIIGFNLFGWIWKKTRILHLTVVVLTAACWFILGIWFGIGYCPITDWQWQIKEKLGQQNLPNSFIKYYADELFGKPVNATLIDSLTAGCFFAALLLSIYFNFIRRKTAAMSVLFSDKKNP